MQTAAKQANVVSMSWGGSEFAGETAYDTAAYFANPNVTFIAASGDDGGAAARSGRPLPPTSSASAAPLCRSRARGRRSAKPRGVPPGRGLPDTAAAPGAQPLRVGTELPGQCAGHERHASGETPDVASDANPSTGLSVYDSVPGSGQTGWFQVGGTSAGAPRSGQGSSRLPTRPGLPRAEGSLSSTQTLSLLYGISSSASYTPDFHDITSGSNFVATAKTGYDKVTGLGSPVASNLIAAASTTSATTSVAKATVVTTTAATTATTHATPHDQVVARGRNAPRRPAPRPLRSPSRPVP